MNYTFFCSLLVLAAVLSTHAVHGNSVTTESPPANVSSAQNETAPHRFNIFSPLAALRSFLNPKAVSANSTKANNVTNVTVHSVRRREAVVLNASLANDSHNKTETATIEPRKLEAKSNVSIVFNSKLPIQDKVPRRGALNSSQEANTSSIHPRIRRTILSEASGNATTNHVLKNETLGRAIVKVQLHKTTKNATNQNSSVPGRGQLDGVEGSRIRRQTDDDGGDDQDGRHHMQRLYPPIRPYKQEHVRPYLPQRPYPQNGICHSSQPCPCGMSKCKMPCRDLVYNAPPQVPPVPYEQRPTYVPTQAPANTQRYPPERY